MNDYDDDDYVKDCDEKIAMYQDMKILHIKAMDMIDTRLSELDHDATEEDVTRITNEVWGELETK